MIRNRMPLRKLVAFIVLAIAFSTGCISYGITYEIQDRTDESFYIFIGFGITSFLLVLIAVGLWQKQNWARILLIGMLGLGILGWSTLAIFWYLNMETSDRIERFLPFIFSGFLIPIMLAGIFLLNHSKLEEEFEKEELREN